MTARKDPYLLTPGPLTTAAATKEAMLHDWGSRDTEFIAANAGVRERLVAIAGGAGTHVCVPMQGSGTFVVEAALGTLVPRIEAVAAAPLVKEQFESLAMQAERKKVILENQVPEGLEVMADPLLLAEVLHNLLSNALKFSHEGQRVVVLAEGEGSLGPVLVVMDEGIGMPGQVLKGLFDQGTSVSRPGTMDEVGTGFGLPFCFEIMEAHGGRIWATSEEGKGSRFFVELPREPAK